MTFTRSFEKVSWQDKLKGGKGDELDPDDVDQRELKAGVKIEQEHTKNKHLAKEIALDHLAEHRKYYTKLRRAKL